MTNRAGDILTASLAMALAIAIYGLAQDLDDGPAQMPTLVAAILGSAGTLMLLRAWFRKIAIQELFSDADPGALAVLLLGWVTMVVLADQIGFFVMIACFLASLQWWLAGRPRTAAGCSRAAAFAVLTTGLLWAVFVGVLNVRFPATWLF